MYEIVPGFILCSLAIYFVSKYTAEATPETTAQFDEMLLNL